VTHGVLRTHTHAAAMAESRPELILAIILSLLAISSSVSAAPALLQPLPGECSHALLYFSQVDRERLPSADQQPLMQASGDVAACSCSFFVHGAECGPCSHDR
jgi:hypothetical protein